MLEWKGTERTFCNEQEIKPKEKKSRKYSAPARVTGFAAVLEHYPSAPNFKTVLNLELMCLRWSVLSIPILSIALQEMRSIHIKVKSYVLFGH